MLLTHTNQLKNIPQRIVSVVPSQTELLHYLGLEKETIGITKFCIHPDHWYRNKTRVGGTKSLSIEKIIELQPDLIIANKEENVKEQIELLAEKFTVWVTDVNNLEQALQMIGDIGALTANSTKASALCSEIATRFNYISLPEKKIRSSYLIWKKPYMSAGGDTFINDMLEKAGFENVFKNKTRYPEISIELLRKAGCEVILLSSEPYPFSEKHISELENELPGVKILLADGEMFSWYGSHLLKSPGYFKQLIADCNQNL